MSDKFSLQRFVNAQNPVLEQVVQELRQGRKQTHWMWFVFPQVFGLGCSAIAERYAIRSMAEATAYLDHPILGNRLLECVALTRKIEQKNAKEVFGYPDDLKFRSSLTLFRETAKEESLFSDALEKYFAGEHDTRTLEILRSWKMSKL
ncbi:MAG: DUF1810 domain-containing protein [Candidatus Electrothrix sp. AR4]|nr:DUF1810 domain-containing protein [Candidatus Electrothrix sp. AR4]